jgi:hypothetical protein
MFPALSILSRGQSFVKEPKDGLFQDPKGGLHYLSEQDIANGGETYLPMASVQISNKDAAALTSPSIQQIKLKQMGVINARANELLAALSAAYPEGEVQSWSQQAKEAEALNTNPNAPTPLLAAIATARGLSLMDLTARVIAKMTAFAHASGQIIGQRQALEDAVNAVDLNASDAVAQLEAIQWPT